MNSTISTVKTFLLDLQNRLMDCLIQENKGGSFLKEPWEHAEGGGGLTCVLEQGPVIEKAGVNFSHIHGDHLPASALQTRSENIQGPFEALGVSTVIHPVNPYAPTAHMNVRFISVETATGTYAWFGGGFDLTPYYGFTEDTVHWHQTAKAACDPFGRTVYAQYKKACDEYFYLKHRQEPRGIGGLFFDDLCEWGFETCFSFMQSVGNHFIKAYQPILSQRKQHPFTERERNFQLYRRGRYVEFNLLYDRGTLFGLQSGGRIESILVSLPPLVSWVYDKTIKEDERILLQQFLHTKEWIK